MCTDSNVGAGDLSRALRQQLLATVISTASQIQMEKGSHSVAPLIMYGTDGAARLWTTGGPSHVPVEPSANVLQITHVSPRFTKHLYLAPHSQRQKVPNLRVSSNMAPKSADGMETNKLYERFGSYFLLFYTRSQPLF